MVVRVDREQLIARRLKDANLRSTGGRNLVLEAMKTIGQPVAVPEIHELVNDHVPLSSLYRIIGDLVDARVLRKLEFEEGFARYELDEDLNEHHHHLFCTQCGSVADLALHDIERRLDDTIATIASSHGFMVQAHRLDFFGLCRSCIATNTDTNAGTSAGAISTASPMKPEPK
jgi:Fur family transcriptional regulator, ferric uptake regulator